MINYDNDVFNNNNNKNYNNKTAEAQAQGRLQEDGEG